ncbi:MAG: glycosyltransferase family 4 protein [Bacteroidetes bacterium]|nr:glycosyltransferase family 4 protein [Bacteroidota bacterium]
MKNVIISVTNDLTTDQRVDRVCNTLIKMGFGVLLVGRKLRQSLPLKPRNYRTKRMKLLFTKGPWFYAEYNLRLFFFLIFHKADLLVSNDLDTLLANYLASVLRRIPLVHDCHEYFRGVPELNHRPGTVRIWKRIEDFIFPKLKNVYAVNASIAEIYRKEYGNEVRVIRNVPSRKLPGTIRRNIIPGIPEGARIILYQGSVNVDRGLDEAITAMQFMKTKAILLIIGTGDVIDKLKLLSENTGVRGKVIFTGPILLEELHEYTVTADIGLSIEKDVSLNYHYCLPNKFLDYIQAQVPVLVSPLPEMMAIVEKYGIGETIESHDPKHLASKFDAMLNDHDKLALYHANLAKAASDLCWENEEPELMNIYQRYA